MAEQVERLPSKIVQVSGDGSEDQSMAYVLCEDGSMWIYQPTHSKYRQTHGEYQQVHPPHEPPTQAGDLAEALAALRNLVEWASVTPGCAEIESREAFEAAKSLLKKHGVGK